MHSSEPTPTENEALDLDAAGWTPAYPIWTTDAATVVLGLEGSLVNASVLDFAALREDTRRNGFDGFFHGRKKMLVIARRSIPNPFIKTTPQLLAELTQAESHTFHVVEEVSNPDRWQDGWPSQYVYGEMTDWGGDVHPLILPRTIVEQLVEIWHLFGSSTWGEVRSNASPTRYKEFVELSGYGPLSESILSQERGERTDGLLNVYGPLLDRHDEGPPTDDRQFDPNDIEGYQSGDYPPYPLAFHSHHLPDEIIGEFATQYETTLNGTYTKIAIGKLDQATDGMKQLGFTCEADPALFEELQDGYVTAYQ